jgi:Spy/CpxP family protein refolding chaperone
VNTWKAILAVLVIFGAGFVTGHVASRLSESAKPPAVQNAARTPTRSAQPPLSLEQLRKVELMGRVQKDLDLTPEQHARIEKIIEDSQGRIRDLWDQVAPDIHDEYDDVQKKLCQELTPDQKKTFDDLMKKKQQLHINKPSGTNAPAQPQALQIEEDKCPDMCSLTSHHPAS